MAVRGVVKRMKRLSRAQRIVVVLTLLALVAELLWPHISRKWNNWVYVHQDVARMSINMLGTALLSVLVLLALGSSERRLFLATILILGYLVPHPHLGIVYVLTTSSAFVEEGKVVLQSGPFHDVYPTFQACEWWAADWQDVPTHRSSSISSIVGAATRVTTARCDPKVRLLWGWN